MKKALLAFFALVFVFTFAASVALAGGGKVQGDNALGEAYQNCVHPDGSETDETFETCPFDQVQD